jgi:glutamyl-tRNA synthetase
LSNRVVAWNDVISGRREAKLPAVSDPILVAADGTPSPILTAVVDDIADGITHVIRADDGDGMTGIHIDLLSALGQNPDAVTFAHIPPLEHIGRLPIHGFRHDGIDPEALVSWLGGGAGFSLRGMAAKPDPAALPSINRAILATRDFAAVADHLPPGATEPFWLAIRGSVDLLTEARHWWDVVNGSIYPMIPDRALAFAPVARAALPPEPWDETTWSQWLAALPADAGQDRAAMLRFVLTGDDQGPELARLLPLIGRPRVMERLRGA